MRHKNQKPPIFVGGSENCALLCPRYMNVPLPAPCHVNVAGVGKQSVWGLRIIAISQLSLWHDSANSSIAERGKVVLQPSAVEQESLRQTPWNLELSKR